MATQLAEHAYTVRVAHAFHVKLIWQARAKTDPIDARKLAELMRRRATCLRDAVSTETSGAAATAPTNARREIPGGTSSASITDGIPA